MGDIGVVWTGNERPEMLSITAVSRLLGEFASRR